MAVYPNGSYITMSPGKFFGGTGVVPGVLSTRQGDLMGRFTAENWSAIFGGMPVGAGAGGAVLLPLTAGSLDASDNLAEATVSTLNVVAGRNVDGSITCTFTVADAQLGLIVSGEGTATCTLTVNNATLAAGIFAEGTATASLTVDPSTIGALAGIFSGPVTCSLDANNSTITAVGHLAGDILPYTELSPENLARAVWQALATEYNEAGTMGEKLNLAGTGGVDLNALAAAVLAAAQAAPIHADVRKVNSYTVTGTGQDGNTWGPA